MDALSEAQAQRILSQLGQLQEADAGPEDAPDEQPEQTGNRGRPTPRRRARAALWDAQQHEAGYRQPQQKPGLNVATTQAAKRSLWRAQHALVIIAGVLTSIVHCLDVALDAVVVQALLVNAAPMATPWAAVALVLLLLHFPVTALWMATLLYSHDGTLHSQLCWAQAAAPKLLVAALAPAWDAAALTVLHLLPMADRRVDWQGDEQQQAAAGSGNASMTWRERLARCCMCRPVGSSTPAHHSVIISQPPASAASSFTQHRWHQPRAGAHARRVASLQLSSGYQPGYVPEMITIREPPRLFSIRLSMSGRFSTSQAPPWLSRPSTSQRQGTPGGRSLATTSNFGSARHDGQLSAVQRATAGRHSLQLELASSQALPPKRGQPLLPVGHSSSATWLLQQGYQGHDLQRASTMLSPLWHWRLLQAELWLARHRAAWLVIRAFTESFPMFILQAALLGVVKHQAAWSEAETGSGHTRLTAYLSVSLAFSIVSFVLALVEVSVRQAHSRVPNSGQKGAAATSWANRLSSACTDLCHALWQALQYQGGVVLPPSWSERLGLQGGRHLQSTGQAQLVVNLGDVAPLQRLQKAVVLHSALVRPAAALHVTNTAPPRPSSKGASTAKQGQTTVLVPSRTALEQLPNMLEGALAACRRAQHQQDSLRTLSGAELSAAEAGEAGAHDGHNKMPAATLHSASCRAPPDTLPDVTLSLSSLDTAGSTTAQIARRLAPCLHVLLTHGLTSLSLYDTPPLTSGFQVLSSFLSQPTCRLRYMSLRECGFSVSSFGVLTAALGSNASVTELDVSSNPLASLGDEIAEMVRSMLQSNRTLRRLVLSYTGLQSEHAVTILQGAHACPSLETLDLSQNRLGDTLALPLQALLPGGLAGGGGAGADDDDDERIVYEETAAYSAGASKQRNHGQRFSLDGSMAGGHLPGGAEEDVAPGLTSLDLSFNFIGQSLAGWLLVAVEMFPGIRTGRLLLNHNTSEVVATPAISRQISRSGPNVLANSGISGLAASSWGQLDSARSGAGGAAERGLDFVLHLEAAAPWILPRIQEMQVLDLRGLPLPLAFTAQAPACMRLNRPRSAVPSTLNSAGGLASAVPSRLMSLLKAGEPDAGTHKGADQAAGRQVQNSDLSDINSPSLSAPTYGPWPAHASPGAASAAVTAKQSSRVSAGGHHPSPLCHAATDLSHASAASRYSAAGTQGGRDTTHSHAWLPLPIPPLPQLPPFCPPTAGPVSHDSSNSGTPPSWELGHWAASQQVAVPQHILAAACAPGAVLDLGSRTWRGLTHAQRLAVLYAFMHAHPRILITNTVPAARAADTSAATGAVGAASLAAAAALSGAVLDEEVHTGGASQIHSFPASTASNIDSLRHTVSGLSAAPRLSGGGWPASLAPPATSSSRWRGRISDSARTPSPPPSPLGPVHVSTSQATVGEGSQQPVSPPQPSRSKHQVEARKLSGLPPTSPSHSRRPSAAAIPGHTVRWSDTNSAQHACVAAEPTPQGSTSGTPRDGAPLKPALKGSRSSQALAGLQQQYQQTAGRVDHARTPSRMNSMAGSDAAGSGLPAVYRSSRPSRSDSINCTVDSPVKGSDGRVLEQGSAGVSRLFGASASEHPLQLAGSSSFQRSGSHSLFVSYAAHPQINAVLVTPPPGSQQGGSTRTSAVELDAGRLLPSPVRWSSGAGRRPASFNLAQHPLYTSVSGAAPGSPRLRAAASGLSTLLPADASAQLQRPRSGVSPRMFAQQQQQPPVEEQSRSGRRSDVHLVPVPSSLFGSLLAQPSGLGLSTAQGGSQLETIRGASSGEHEPEVTPTSPVGQTHPASATAVVVEDDTDMAVDTSTSNALLPGHEAASANVTLDSEVSIPPTAVIHEGEEVYDPGPCDLEAPTPRRFGSLGTPAPPKPAPVQLESEPPGQQVPDNKPVSSAAATSMPEAESSSQAETGGELTPVTNQHPSGGTTANGHLLHQGHPVWSAAWAPSVAQGQGFLEGGELLMLGNGSGSTARVANTLNSWLQGSSSTTAVPSVGSRVLEYMSLAALGSGAPLPVVAHPHQAASQPVPSPPEGALAQVRAAAISDVTTFTRASFNTYASAQPQLPGPTSGADTGQPAGQEATGSGPTCQVTVMEEPAGPGLLASISGSGRAASSSAGPDDVLPLLDSTEVLVGPLPSRDSHHHHGMLLPTPPASGTFSSGNGARQAAAAGTGQGGSITMISREHDQGAGGLPLLSQPHSLMSTGAGNHLFDPQAGAGLQLARNQTPSSGSIRLIAAGAEHLQQQPQHHHPNGSAGSTGQLAFAFDHHQQQQGTMAPASPVLVLSTRMPPSGAPPGTKAATQQGTGPQPVAPAAAPTSPKHGTTLVPQPQLVPHSVAAMTAYLDRSRSLEANCQHAPPSPPYMPNRSVTAGEQEPALAVPATQQGGTSATQRSGPPAHKPSRTQHLLAHPPSPSSSFMYSGADRKSPNNPRTSNTPATRAGRGEWQQQQQQQQQGLVAGAERDTPAASHQTTRQGMGGSMMYPQQQDGSFMVLQPSAVAPGYAPAPQPHPASRAHSPPASAFLAAAVDGGGASSMRSVGAGALGGGGHSTGGVATLVVGSYESGPCLRVPLTHLLLPMWSVLQRARYEHHLLVQQQRQAKQQDDISGLPHTGLGPSLPVPAMPPCWFELHLKGLPEESRLALDSLLALVSLLHPALAPPAPGAQPRASLSSRPPMEVLASLAVASQQGQVLLQPGRQWSQQLHRVWSGRQQQQQQGGDAP